MTMEILQDLLERGWLMFAKQSQRTTIFLSGEERVHVCGPEYHFQCQSFFASYGLVKIQRCVSVILVLKCEYYPMKHTALHWQAVGLSPHIIKTPPSQKTSSFKYHSIQCSWYYQVYTPDLSATNDAPHSFLNICQGLGCVFYNFHHEQVSITLPTRS